MSTISLFSIKDMKKNPSILVVGPQSVEINTLVRYIIQQYESINGPFDCGYILSNQFDYENKNITTSMCTQENFEEEQGKICCSASTKSHKNALVVLDNPDSDRRISGSNTYKRMFLNDRQTTFLISECPEITQSVACNIDYIILLGGCKPYVKNYIYNRFCNEMMFKSSYHFNEILDTITENSSCSMILDLNEASRTRSYETGINRFTFYIDVGQQLNSLSNPKTIQTDKTISKSFLSHPLVSTTCAFLLGLTITWLLRR